MLAAAVAAWAALTVPRLAPLPRTRQTVLDSARRLGSRGFLAPTTGLAATTAALAALTPSLPTLLPGALLAGAGIGLATPLGLAALAALAAPDRLGQTMGCAEIGRELGDAGGPLLVGAAATALTLPSGLLILATTLTACAAALALTRLPATPRRRYSDRPTP